MDSLKIELRDTEKGKGLFAKELIKAGELIAEFDGEIYDDSEVEINKPADGQTKWTQDLNDHCVQFEDGKWRYSKGLAIFSNHSCDPNCGIKELFKIVAMKDIAKDEEITWDYDMTEDNEPDDKESFYYWTMKCKCGTKNCRGKIGTYRNLPKEFRDRYKGFISDWLIKKYGNG